jgi:hypothetical protein
MRFFWLLHILASKNHKQRLEIVSIHNENLLDHKNQVKNQN